MAFPNRVLALAGCVLIAAACTEDTTTAPPVTAGVGIEALPTTWGEESGTVTLVKHRDFHSFCWLKVSLKGLFDATEAGDHYNLYAGLWETPLGTIYESDIRRGAFRGEFLWPKSYGDDLLHLAYVQASGGMPADRPIGTPNSLTITYDGFKLVNRCY